MSSDKPTMIRPRNTMLERLGGRPGVAGKVDANLLKKAEETVAKVGANYGDRVKTELDELHSLANRLLSETDKRAEIIHEINKLVHEIRGQGATFGYPLLTKFAGSLFNFTEGLENPNERQLALIRAHIDTMTGVVKNRITGDGGPVGAQIDQTLAAAIQKYGAHKP